MSHSKRDFRAVASDWDGTFVNADRMVTQATKRAVHSFQAAGGILLICSGRPVHGIYAAAARSDFDLSDTILIGCNGAHVETGTSETLFEQSIDPEAVRDVWRYACRLGLVPIGVNEHGAYTTDPTYPPAKEEIVENAHDYAVVTDITDWDTTHTHKLLLTKEPYVPQSDVDALRTAFASDIEAALSEPPFLEVTAIGVSKGATLARIVPQLGLELTDVIGIGDSYNDLSLVQTAGMGAAITNAVPELRAAADFVAPSNNEDGVAYVIEKFGVR